MHIAAAHAWAAAWADLMLSTRPFRKRRREADSYVLTKYPYILQKRKIQLC